MSNGQFYCKECVELTTKKKHEIRSSEKGQANAIHLLKQLREIVTNIQSEILGKPITSIKQQIELLEGVKEVRNFLR